MFLLFFSDIVFDNAKNISLIIGDETACSDESITSTPCDGPLKPSTTYKYIKYLVFLL